MTDFIVAVDTSRLDAKLKRVPKQVEAAVVRAVQRLAINLQGYVKDQKLTGQVLHVRTGTLRRSINQEVAQSRGHVRGVVGTNVRYARPHEYGFSGDVFVRPHVRVRRELLTYAQKYKKSGRVVSGKVIGESMVVGHTRHVELPERSFLRSALKEFEPRIINELQAAARGGVLR